MVQLQLNSDSFLYLELSKRRRMNTPVSEDVLFGFEDIPRPELKIVYPLPPPELCIGSTLQPLVTLDVVLEGLVGAAAPSVDAVFANDADMTKRLITLKGEQEVAPEVGCQEPTESNDDMKKPLLSVCTASQLLEPMPDVGHISGPAQIVNYMI